MDLLACHKGTKTKRTARQQHRAFSVRQRATRPQSGATKVTAMTPAPVFTGASEGSGFNIMTVSSHKSLVL